MSGRNTERFGSDTARIFTLPDATCGVTEIAASTAICTSLRSSAVIAAGEDG